MGKSRKWTPRINLCPCGTEIKLNKKMCTRCLNDKQKADEDLEKLLDEADQITAEYRQAELDGKV